MEGFLIMPIKGAEEANANLDRILDEKWEEVCQAFEEVTMGKIMPECMEECPVDSGVLRQSIPGVSHMERTPADCTAVIGAGGAAGAYATVQHECLEFHHTTGKAKFIEDPVMRNAPDIPAMVLARIQK